jgi:hypothetical protein
MNLKPETCRDCCFYDNVADWCLKEGTFTSPYNKGCEEGKI